MTRTGHLGARGLVVHKDGTGRAKGGRPARQANRELDKAKRNERKKSNKRKPVPPRTENSSWGLEEEKEPERAGGEFSFSASQTRAIVGAAVDAAKAAHGMTQAMADVVENEVMEEIEEVDLSREPRKRKAPPPKSKRPAKRGTGTAKATMAEAVNVADVVQAVVAATVPLQPARKKQRKGLGKAPNAVARAAVAIPNAAVRAAVAIMPGHAIRGGRRRGGGGRRRGGGAAAARRPRTQTQINAARERARNRRRSRPIINPADNQYELIDADMRPSVCSAAHKLWIAPKVISYRRKAHCRKTNRRVLPGAE